MTATCVDCSHLPHPGRACAVKHVSGPAVDNPHNIAHEHRGRTVTLCGCTQYTPATNGKEPIECP